MIKKFLWFLYLGVIALLTANLVNLFVSQAFTTPINAPTVTTSQAVPQKNSANNVDEVIETILSSGLFPKAPPPETTQSAEAEPSPLNLAGKIRALGTVLGDGTGPRAVLEDRATRRQTLYHLGDDIPGIGRLQEIHRDGVVIQQGAQREFLKLASGTPTSVPGTTHTSLKTPSAATFKVRRLLDRREVEHSTADLPKLLSQARAVPHYTGSTLDGWRFAFVKPSSFFHTLGLQKGDVVQKINGVEVRDPGMMLTLFQQVKDESTVRLDMLRNNQRMTVTYEIR